MSTPALPADRPEAGDGASAEAPIEVDLHSGRVAITPVLVDGESRYTVTELPDGPLSGDDVEGLAVALQVARSRHAVLIDVQDYAGTEPTGL